MDLGPGLIEQVVALRHDEHVIGPDRDRAGDRLLEGALEVGCIDVVRQLGLEPPEQREVAATVECLDRTLRRESPVVGEGDVGEVEAIHRHVSHANPTFAETAYEGLGERCLASARRSGDAEDRSLTRTYECHRAGRELVHQRGVHRRILPCSGELT